MIPRGKHDFCRGERDHDLLRGMRSVQRGDNPPDRDHDFYRGGGGGYAVHGSQKTLRHPWS